MYYYFSSSFPAVIKINGVYFGEIFNSVKFINLEGEQNFIEVCSLDSTQKSINLLLDSANLKVDNPLVSITDLKGGYLFKFIKTYTFDKFLSYKQSRFSRAQLTAFCEGKNFLSIESANDFYVENVDFYFSSVEFVELNSSLILAVFFGEKTLVLGYKIENKITKVYSSICDEFNVDTLTLKTNYLDMAKHSLSRTIKVENNNIVEKDIRLTAKKNLLATKLNEQLIPYAFLEEFLVKGEYSQYLGENIKENADKLTNFLGSFIGVMPPPFFRSPNEVGLIYKKDENLYFADYYTFKVNGGKIVNLTKND